MTGMEELIKRGYLDSRKPTSRKLNPDKLGSSYGILKLGDTTFSTLKTYLDIDLAEANNYNPSLWSKPARIGSARPDSLVVQGRSVVAVVEHKSPGELNNSTERRKGLEQLQTYMLLTKSKLGILTDGTFTRWVHNLDSKRKFIVKTITENSLFCSRDFNAKNLEYVNQKLDYLSDEVSAPPSFDPSVLARSIWQDVYIATRQDPEKCFQTFVELFMYKLMSDYELLPNTLRIENLAVDNNNFKNETGMTQIEYYFSSIRPIIKSHQLFLPMNTDVNLGGLTKQSGYTSTKSLVPSIDTNGGKTSIIDGHAFRVQPIDYNSAFVGILKKLNSLPHIMHLDPGFKSRVYEQFLRRDPNTSKVTGKYFTPRNVVKAIVQMAEVAMLHKDAIICDPACGVGGFITESILELQRNGVSNYREESEGKITVERKFIGMEVLEDVVCLAKSNMLLHCIELYSNFSTTAKQNFTQLLADTFIHCHEDRTLGSLKHPVEETFDLIMANPPYVVSGTQNITQKIKEAKLTGYYDAGGSGLESRFLNWIINSLKHGGRAYVILPKSMLARVNNGFKEWIRRKCIVDALISLPERTFYTTPNTTYILALTRKQDDDIEQVEPVFCYYIRDIGETRDVERNPARNDLVEMVEEFKMFKASKSRYTPTTNFCKVVPPSVIHPSLRWDVDYLWTPSELSELGVVDTNVRPYTSVIEELQEIQQDLQSAKDFIQSLLTQANSFSVISLNDERYFKIHRGNRVTDHECKEHPGDIPVVSSGRHENSYLGTISETYLVEKELPVFESSDKFMTVGSTGAVGIVHMRRETKWFLHDDALAIEVLDEQLIPQYVRYALQNAIDVARFDYTAKLYTERLRALEIKVPIDPNQVFEKDMQESIAQAYQRKEAVERKLKQLALHLQGISIEF